MATIPMLKLVATDLRCECGGWMLKSGFCKAMWPPISHHICERCEAHRWFQDDGHGENWKRVTYLDGQEPDGMEGLDGVALIPWRDAEVPARETAG